ncbi:TATA-box-binding protein [Candidatus Bathyarchaeota archaeon]|nr:TATA-box-binding protein [Candidatus Bathyarchaeota archaeon]
MKGKVQIQNVVVSVVTHQPIDLNSITSRFPQVEYRPKVFPGLCFRLKKPKTATLIFSTGRMVCTGAKSVREAKSAVHTVLRMLKREGIIAERKIEITVQNIVASADLGCGVDLNRAVEVLDNIMYEPEQFPGAIYRMEEPKVVILIFSQGKLVVTGAKREEEAAMAVERLNTILQKEDLIYPL